ncbi:transcriptional regulator [Halegenticoccus soli]|uniref:transcriptional regulator n=1 Tax=Halegenticoccus soli TaxID=1985678 RepID=UPI001E553C66|nr:transcriptional regulator [Halegenticoccus soli]
MTALDVASDDETPAVQAVLDALDDADCRAIVRRLDGAMTARELSEACDIPLSTVYRKLDRLTEASLVDERLDLRADGHHTRRYRLAFGRVRFALGDDRGLEATIARPSDSADERLARLWSEVRTGR